MARWGYASNSGIRAIASWLVRVTLVGYALFVLGGFWYGALLTEAGRHAVPRTGKECSDREKNIPENECVSVFDNLVLLAPKPGTRDNAAVALGRAEFHQAPGPDSAVDSHVEFSREYERETQNGATRETLNFYISNISTSKRLALTFDDKVEIDAGLNFLDLNDVISLPGRGSATELTIQAVTETSITLVHQDNRIWTVSSDFGKPMLRGTDVAPRCQGSFSLWFPGDWVAAARSLAEPIHSDGIREIVSLGGEVTCANDDIAMIGFEEVKTRVARIVHVKGRGMALIATEGAPVVVRDGTRLKNIKRARHLVGKLDLTSAASGKSPVVKEFVAGRTAYHVDFKGQSESAIFDPGTIVITPKARQHRMVGICAYIDSDLLRRTCVDASNTPQVWENLRQSKSVVAKAVAIGSMFVLTWYFLAVAFFYKRTGWPRGLELTRQWLVVLVAATAIGAAAIAVRPPDPPELATGIGWPLPAIVAWCLAVLATSMAAGVRYLACLLLLAVSGLLLTGHQAMATLAFSTGELRLASHFQQFSVGLALGAVLLAFVATINTQWLRERIADLAPLLSARGLKDRILHPLVDAWRRYRAAWGSDGPNMTSAWRTFKALLWFLGALVQFVLIGGVAIIAGSIFWIFAVLCALVAVVCVALLGLIIFPLSKLFLGTPFVALWLWGINGAWKHFSRARRAAGRMPSGLIFVGVSMAIAILAWLFLGVETGIANLFQPSEIMKSLVVILLSAAALAVLGTTTGLRRAPPLRDLWWALLVVFVVLAMVLLAPIVRSDMSPFLILITLTVLMIPFIAFIFFVMWAREEFDIVIRGASRVMPPRLGATTERGDRTLARRLKAEARKIGGLLKSISFKPVAIAMLLCATTLLIAGLFYTNAIQHPSWVRDAAYANIAGSFRTPALRLLSWVELTPQAALNMAEPANPGLPVTPAVVEFPDTGRQVMTARRLIDGSPCYWRGLRIDMFDPAARYIGLPAPSGWLELDPAVWILGKDLDKACASPAEPIDEVRQRAARMFAIQNDFVAALVFVSMGRDGAIRLAALQAVFLLLMLAIAWRLTSRRHVRENWRVTSTIAAHMVIGFMILVGVHFAISWANTLGLIPVMGQPMTYISAGQSHFLMVGMPTILVAVIASRLTNQALPQPASIVPEPNWIAGWTARFKRKGHRASPYLLVE